MNQGRLPKIMSCGVLCFRREPEMSFLLLRHPRRWDLPKGHLERGESELECALREWWEETGIPHQRLTIDPLFRYETHNPVRMRSAGGRLFDKAYVIFLGYLDSAGEKLPIALTEHEAFRWYKWSPPHHIQKWLIDPLLEAVAIHFETTTPSPPAPPNSDLPPAN